MSRNTVSVIVLQMLQENKNTLSTDRGFHSSQSEALVTSAPVSVNKELKVKTIRNIAEEQFLDDNLEVANLIISAPEMKKALEAVHKRLKRFPDGLSDNQVESLLIIVTEVLYGDEETAYMNGTYHPDVNEEGK